MYSAATTTVTANVNVNVVSSYTGGTTRIRASYLITVPGSSRYGMYAVVDSIC